MKHYLIDTNVVIDMLTDRIGSPQISAIITRNVKDFQSAELEVINSLEFNR